VQLESFKEKGDILRGNMQGKSYIVSFPLTSYREVFQFLLVESQDLLTVHIRVRVILLLQGNPQTPGDVGSVHIHINVRISLLVICVEPEDEFNFQYFGASIHEDIRGEYCCVLTEYSIIGDDTGVDVEYCAREDNLDSLSLYFNVPGITCIY
jgi:hypothetical protein